MSDLNGNHAGREVEMAVFRAVDRVNEVLTDLQQLSKNRETPLLADGTNLDSLAIINLLVSIEDEILESLGRQLTLVGDDTTELDREALQTLGTLIDALAESLAASPENDG
jgi:hypothetical protein